MANGMRQIDGVDVEEAFVPVVKLSAIRLVLSIVVSKAWDQRQSNVSNAFLHGVLKEEV